MDFSTLANALAKGGAVAVIGVLLFVIFMLLRRWVIIPDPNTVPREMYNIKAKEAEDWKAIVKEYGESLKDAITVLEAMEPRSSRR